MHVETLRGRDRAALCQMLEGSGDFPQNLVYLYRRTASRYVTLVAWCEGEISGVLTGSFDSDFTGNSAFEAFELPRPPHAFLERIHVRESVRSRGVGRALLEAYASEASERGCTFIGGSIDLSTDPRLRRKFFVGVGFTIRAHDNFGASPIDIITATTQH
ncbi:GNAT family N-acetyltransferase [Leucobacter chinensis]|uniref:GNAT family N-acetyltransferase n=1 Tax=Leucobacter chinensis TaxID=2851010 RepID=UPI001C2196F9|nr:GNAT family N-acetyltransferase [Leucobacter chinensis]